MCSRTPFDALGGRVEAVVFALGRQIAGKRQRHSSDTAPNVEHLMVRTQLSVLDEIAKVLFSGGREISVAHKTPQPARRNIETAGNIDEVENRSLRIF